MIRDSPWLLTVFMGLVVLWAPLPFGSVEVWSQTLLAGSVFAVAACAIAWDRGESALRIVGPTAAALCLIAFLALAVSVSWPARLVALVSPEHLRLQRAAETLLGGPQSERAALTLSPHAAQKTALLWFVAGAALLAGAAVGVSRRGRRLLLGTLLVGGLFQLLYGAPRWLGKTGRIWGVAVGGTAARLRGTFVNPDHLAAYLELVLAAALAWMWWGQRRARRERLPERWMALVLPPALLWLAFFAAVSLTGSRAGLLAVAVGTLVQGLLLAAVNRRWSWLPLALGVALCGFSIAAAVAGRQGFERWLTTSSYEVGWASRASVSRGALLLWARFPWVGVGPGAFGEAFPLVMPGEIARFSWEHGHNDWLELLVTGGALATCGLALALFFGLRRLARVLRDGRRSEDRAAALAALGALASLSVHELFDFGLTIPALAVTLCTVCGAAAAAATDDPNRADGPPREPLDRRRESPPPGGADPPPRETESRSFLRPGR